MATVVRAGKASVTVKANVYWGSEWVNFPNLSEMSYILLTVCDPNRTRDGNDLQQVFTAMSKAAPGGFYIEVFQPLLMLAPLSPAPAKVDVDWAVIVDGP
jgi:hypothetical protein